MTNKGTIDPDKVKKIKEHLLAGKNTKYDESTHIELLYDVFSVGEDIAAFCADALISKPTFYSWLKKNEKFKNAFDTVINISARHWENLPMTEEGKDINYQYWFMIMKNRFGYGKPRFVVNEGQGHTPKEIINAIFIALGNSELTIQEATQLASLAVTQANIENGTTGNNSDNLRYLTPDETREKLKLLDEIILKMRALPENKGKKIEA